MALLSGILPYRDYYTAGPPFNQLNRRWSFQAREKLDLPFTFAF